MSKILTFLTVVLLIATSTSCEKSDDLSDNNSLNGTVWQMSNETFAMRLHFKNDSLCSITTGATDGRYGTNYTEYNYKKAYGIDLMIFNKEIVEYTVNFLDGNKLQLYHSVNNEIQEPPIVLNKLK